MSKDWEEIRGADIRKGDIIRSAAMRSWVEVRFVHESSTGRTMEVNDGWRIGKTSKVKRRLSDVASPGLDQDRTNTDDPQKDADNTFVTAYLPDGEILTGPSGTVRAEIEDRLPRRLWGRVRVDPATADEVREWHEDEAKRKAVWGETDRFEVRADDKGFRVIDTVKGSIASARIGDKDRAQRQAAEMNRKQRELAARWSESMERADGLAGYEWPLELDSMSTIHLDDEWALVSPSDPAPDEARVIWEHDGMRATYTLAGRVGLAGHRWTLETVEEAIEEPHDDGGAPTPEDAAMVAETKREGARCPVDATDTEYNAFHGLDPMAGTDWEPVEFSVDWEIQWPIDERDIARTLQDAGFRVTDRFAVDEDGRRVPEDKGSYWVGRVVVTVKGNPETAGEEWHPVDASGEKLTEAVDGRIELLDWRAA